MTGKAIETSGAVVRRSFELFQRTGVRAAAESSYAEDVVFVDIPEFPGGGEHHGREATTRHLEQFFEAWDDYELTLKDVRDAGERAAAHFVLSVRGRSSGLDTELELWHVCLVRDGRIARVEAYRQESQAMAALAAQPSR
jgi:ketosteroid isomerase-like protein